MAIDNTSTAWIFGSYDADRKRLIKISENAQLFAGTGFNGHPNADFHRIHDDGVDIPTLGYGLNLNSHTYEYISAAVSAAYGGAITASVQDALDILQLWKTGSNVLFDGEDNAREISAADVLRGSGWNDFVVGQIVHPQTFTYNDTSYDLNDLSSLSLTEPQADAMLGQMLPDYEQGVTDYLTAHGLPDLPESRERAALVSLNWNGQLSDTNHPELSAALAISDPDAARAEAWYVIRYNLNTHPDQNPGIIKRRYAEAALFGLYDSDGPDLAEAKAVFAMFAAHAVQSGANGHGETILQFDQLYDDRRGQAENEYGLDVPSRRDAFDLALQEVFDKHHVAGPLREMAEVLVDPARDAGGTYDASSIADFNEAVPVLLFGEGGNDTLTGWSKGDLIFGDYGEGPDKDPNKEGTDIISAAAGNDLLFGDGGNDELHGGTGNDIFIGGAGDDKLHADDDSNVDFVHGGTGDDEYHVKPGDVIVGFSEGDRLFVNGIELKGGQNYHPFMSWGDGLDPNSNFYKYDDYGAMIGESGEIYMPLGGEVDGFAIFMPGSDVPVLLYDPQRVEETREAEHHVGWGVGGASGFDFEIGSMSFTRWELGDNASSDSQGIESQYVPGYAWAVYDRLLSEWEGPTWDGDFHGYGGITVPANVAGQLIEIEASGYNFKAHQWDEQKLIEIWSRGRPEPGQNGGDHGFLINPDGINHADANGGPGAPGDGIVSVAAAIREASSLLTPLVIDLDGDGVELTALAQSKAYFDLDANGFAQRTGWVTGGDGLLAIDANENGNIDNVNELFGSTEPYGQATSNGFDALAALDSNEDGTIDASDDQFADLRVWIDADEDGFTDDGELKTLGEVGIESISLSTSASNTTIAGNIISDVAGYAKVGGGTGTVADAWLANSTLDTIDVRDSTISAGIMLMPALRGYGEIGGLRLEMSRNADLLKEVSDLVLYQNRDDGALRPDLLWSIESIILTWTGAWNAEPRGDNIDPNHLAAMERLTGQAFFQTTGPEGPNPGPNAAAMLELAWDDLLLSVGARILAQSVLKPAFPDVTYEWATDSFGGTLDSAAAVTALAAMAPAGADADAYSFWKLAITTLDEIADDLAVDPASYNPALETALANAGFDITADALREVTVRVGYGFTGNEDVVAFVDGDIRTGSGDDRIFGGSGYDTLNGQTGSDTYVFGKNGGHERIIDVDDSGSAVDTVQFATGIAPADVLVARSGDDLVIRIAGSGGEIVVEGQFADTDHGIEQIKFAGGTTWNRVFIEGLMIAGTESDDTLTGTDENNFVDGAAGADAMAGGKGSDTYLVDNAGDAVTEDADEGYDAVLSSISYALSENIEELVLTGGNIDGTGNEMSNVLFGSSGDNTLDGAEGADLLVGGGGSDTFVVDNIDDKIVGYGLVMSSISWSLAANGGNELVLTGTDDIDGAGRDSTDDGYTNGDKLTGNAGNNILSGGAGDDTLDGGAGNDTLIGGADDDTYLIGDLDDVIVEEEGGGHDAVMAGVSYALSANVEDLTLSGSASISGVGNASDNTIVGNSGDNQLSGGAGDDSLDGASGNDTLNGGDGNDTLLGGAGNDTLEGGAGSDSLQGGNGNDTYLIDDADDSIVESSFGGGTDSVLSSIDYTLGTALENLALAGAGSINGTGNSAANILTGNSGDNILDGGSGGDTVNGGSGNDTLKGADGNDTLKGEAGIDTLQGGNGNDILAWDSDDTLDGGANRDTVLHTGAGAIDVDTAKMSNIEVVNLGVGDDNDNGIILSVSDVLDLAASSSGTGFTANKDAIDLLVYGDNAGGIRDNVELDGSWAAAGTFSTSALTGSSITFNIYQASGTQVAVQQGLDLTIA